MVRLDNKFMQTSTLKPFIIKSFDEFTEVEVAEFAPLNHSKPQFVEVEEEPTIEEILEQGYNKGFVEGLEQGKKEEGENLKKLLEQENITHKEKLSQLEQEFEEQTKMLLINLDAGLQTIIEKNEASLGEVKKSAEMLAKEIAYKIADEALKVAGFKNIEKVIATAFEKLGNINQKITIKLNSSAQDLWHKEIKEIFSKYKQFDFVLVLDDSIPTNNCEIDYSFGKIEYDVAGVKKEVEKILFE
jgi:flagellar biosynthesis/type III secretory pathway protein FliH